MNLHVPHVNLVCAWAAILLGFLSGMALGMCFHREDWLGGYASFRRRLYRLGHISFFGLGAVNLFFWLTMTLAPFAGPLAHAASGAFILGAITMPLCCGVMAHFPKLRLIFAIPVLSLIAGGAMTLCLVLKNPPPPINADRSMNRSHHEGHEGGNRVVSSELRGLRGEHMSLLPVQGPKARPIFGGTPSP